MQKFSKYENDARVLFKQLNGLFVIYKPASIAFERMRGTLISNLCRDLNNKDVRPPIKHIAIEGATNKDMRVVVTDSYADNILVVGPRYQASDFRLATQNIMRKNTCGVVVCGLNKGTKLIQKIRENRCTRFFRLKGVLGKATDNYFHDGRIMEKSTYAHVKRDYIDKICSSMQSSHQRKMFEVCGVDIQSQTAYELAIKGLLRPRDSNIPMLYTIKCIDFAPPEFTLEIVSINETEIYLKTLIHNLGMRLHSTATCTQILCIQDGLFNVEHALLKKDWNLENILSNIQMCKKVLDNNPNILNHESSILVEPGSNTSNLSYNEKS